MKKIICFVLAVFMAAITLSACVEEGSVKEPEATTESNLPSYAGKSSADYDTNGNFILTSTDDRIVYPYNSGYVVFTFTGDIVQKIQRVLVFEDKAAAESYTQDQAKKSVENGEVPESLIANGRYVISTVSLSADQGELGNYYTKSRSIVLSDFADEVSQ